MWRVGVCGPDERGEVEADAERLGLDEGEVEDFRRQMNIV
jgi:hypothetical protein